MWRGVCAACSAKLITLLHQQAEPGGDGSEAFKSVCEARGICFSLCHLTEKLTGGTTSWASAQSIEEPVGIHNSGCWLTRRVWCINRLESTAAAGAHYDHLWFTAACTFYCAVDKSVGRAVRHTIQAPLQTTGMIELHLFDLQLFCGFHWL